MANPISASSSDALEDTLSRLAKKSGVKATIILDRSSGAVLKINGQIAQTRASRPSNAPNLPSQSTGSFSGEASNGAASETSAAEELAAKVWAFVKDAGNLVQDMDGEDELKLLRLRTKKQELVIVPDSKYLMILVHDTPPA